METSMEVFKKVSFWIVLELVSAILQILVQTAFQDKMTGILKMVLTASLYILLIGGLIAILYYIIRWKLEKFILAKTQQQFDEIDKRVSKINSDLDKQIDEGISRVTLLISQLNERVKTLDNFLTKKTDDYYAFHIKESNLLKQDVNLLKYISEYRKKHIMEASYRTGNWLFHDVASHPNNPDLQKAGYQKKEIDEVKNKIMDKFNLNKDDAMVILNRYYESNTDNTKTTN